MTTFFYICAGLGGLVLVTQVVLGLFGIGDHHGFDHGGDGLDLLSVRAISASVAFFGIGGLAGSWLGFGFLVGLPLGLIAGALALIGTAAVTRSILRLESDRTARIEEAIGETGSVYLAIPGQHSGLGKVHVNLRGRLVELAATTAAEAIPTGASIEVVDTRGETLVVVPLHLAE